MKGLTRTKKDIEYQDAVSQFGCWCCKQMGNFNDYTLIHHTRGRSSKGSHQSVIPLCSEHHDYYQEGGIHNNKARWEAKWGKQSEIVKELTEWVRGSE